MDTIARNWIELGNNLDAGILNADPYQDFFSGDVASDTSPFRTLVRYGGPLIFDTTGYPLLGPNEEPGLLADLTGSGIDDMVAGTTLYKRIPGFPYFDSLGMTQFIVHGRFPNLGIIGVADVNGDGIPDLVVGANAEFGFSNGIAIYYGSPHIADSAFKYPDDSLQNVPGKGPAVLWRLNNNAKPMLFFEVTATSSDSPHVTYYKIGVLRHLDDLAHDTVVWLSQTTNNDYFNPGDSMIVPQSMYVTDITGDGIPDLLISDNVHIWIFKGSDSLGYYPLTKSRTYYAIPNPRVIDPAGPWMDVNIFGDLMYNCGDLTGSGIPFLAVGGHPASGNFSLNSHMFFYAGGKALDSLYDAVVSIENHFQYLGSIDTLHSIDATGRSAVLLLDHEDFWSNTEDLDFLLYKNADKIPHTINPRWLQAVSLLPSLDFSMNAIPVIANRYTKIFIASPDAREGHLSIRNLLGQEVASRAIRIDPGDNTEYFETSNFPNGTYFAEIEAKGKFSQTRFLVEH